MVPLGSLACTGVRHWGSGVGGGGQNAPLLRRAAAFVPARDSWFMPSRRLPPLLPVMAFCRGLPPGHSQLTGNPDPG